MDPTRYTQLKTRRGFNYSYYCPPPPPAPGKPVPLFEPLGYGLLVPHFLGYGATDKPTDPKVYIGSGHAQDVVDILDAEGIEKVVAIGHDRASQPAHSSPEATGSTDRAFQQEAVKTSGYDAFAYMRFFVHPDAPAITEGHIDSFISLVYPENVQLWRDHLSVDGGARKWIESDACPSYMTPEDQ
ncbi:hypothetical protein B0H11DRAFT_2220979 [Mycena galericulata]|nr:hypothetical protein B0H11DRAFT_2220979 [Mycena galericulata]